MMDSLVLRFSRVGLFGTDFDGIHTDGRVHVTRGEVIIPGIKEPLIIRTESVSSNRRDGLGYDMLKANNIAACIISKEPNKVVLDRAEKLRIPCVHNVGAGVGKLDILRDFANGLGLIRDHVLYIGDDLNDRECLEWAGVPVCPADAHPQVRELVSSSGGYIATRAGGDGVIREVVELLLAAKNLPLTY